MGSFRNTSVDVIPLYWAPGLASHIIIFEEGGLTSSGMMDRVPPWKPLRSLWSSGDIWIAGLPDQDRRSRETLVTRLTRFLLVVSSVSGNSCWPYWDLEFLEGQVEISRIWCLPGISWHWVRKCVESAKLQVERFNPAAFEEYGQASVNLPGQPGETVTGLKRHQWKNSQPRDLVKGEVSASPNGEFYQNFSLKLN